MFSPFTATALIFGLICLLKVRFVEARENNKPPDWIEFGNDDSDSDNDDHEALDIENEEDNDAQPQVLTEPADIQYRGQGLGFVVQNQNNPPNVGDSVVVREGRSRGRSGIFMGFRLEDRAIVQDQSGETFGVPVVLLERINQGEPVAAQDAIRTTDQMEHPIEEPQIEAANVSPLRSAPIQLGEGHQASARTSIQSEDQIDFIWSLRDHASPGKR